MSVGCSPPTGDAAEVGQTIALVAGPGKPPRSVQGLGLPCLAAVLEAAGFSPRVFDLYPPLPDTDDPGLLDERLANVIAHEQPAMVGVTIHTPAYAERVRLARCLRSRLPDTLLVAGGHHPTAEPVDLLRYSDFDVCVVGEGEGTVLDLARGVAQGEGRRAVNWLRQVRGAVSRQSDEIVVTRSRPPVANLDALPFPAHHLLGLEHYAPHPSLGLVSTGLLTYRGCPMRCAFCCNPQGRRVRKRSPAKVVDEMAWVVGELGVRGFNCYDNLFGLNRDHALAVCSEILRRKLDVVWECWTAGDLVDAELAESMRAAGCVRVGFGAESGDGEVLDRARRGFTAPQHRAGIQVLKAAGLEVAAFFMIGLPGESEASVRRTVEFAACCGADEVCFSLHRPYPGSAVWHAPKAFGVRITRGPNFEAYIETESLSRAALLECTEQAAEELTGRGLTTDVLRCDRYAWE